MQTGLHPTLLNALQRHAELARRTAAKAATTDAIKQLKVLSDGLTALDDVKTAGKLDGACNILLRLQAHISAAPPWLRQSEPWKRAEVPLAL